MDKYKDYTYGRTLRFFEAYYPYDTEDVHYDDVMLSMSQCETIDELITIREHVKEKIEKLGGSETYGMLPKGLIEELSKKSSIYSYQRWTMTVKDNLKSDVNTCYDENVLRLLEENESITANVCGECFINLSHCWELSPYKDKIIDVAKKKANIDVSDLLETIVKRNEEFNEHWKNYKGFKEGMNGYNKAKEVVIGDFEYLKQFNRRLLPWEKSMYREIDKEEIRIREEHERLRKEHEEMRKEFEKLRTQREESWNKWKKEEEIERKKIETRKSWAKIIGIIILVLAIIILLITFIPPIDSTIMNWIIAIIVILALLKRG